MHLKSIELSGFKSFAKKSEFLFNTSITAIVGPNGSGKSNVAEAFRFVLGEQSIKSMRGKKGEDLIWGGSEQVPRSGRASARVTFDNITQRGKKLFDVDFDEVVIERVVHRDGVNQYLLNGSQVRLRDVAELLAGANIGSSGHHIISQGEADRILRANPKERREMVEDALGLRAFQYKLSESARKLQKTKENIDQVQALRKEIAPHLKFLKRQVEKIEKTLSLRDDLKEHYREYLKREDVYLSLKAEELALKKRGPEERLSALERELETAKKALELSDKTSENAGESERLASELERHRTKKDELVRELGRIEGQVTFEEKNAARERARQSSSSDIALSLSELRSLRTDAEVYLKEAEETRDMGALRALVHKITERVRSFVDDVTKQGHGSTESVQSSEAELAELREKQGKLSQELEEVTAQELKTRNRYESLRRTVEEAKDESREAERKVFTVRSLQQEVHAVLSEVAHEEEQLSRAREAFERELKEGSTLVGSEILAYKQYSLSKDEVLGEPRGKQGERARTIEKMKLRLEEAGSGGGEDVMKEHEEVQARDEFLEREIQDLEKSEQSLREIISDLEGELTSRFKDGITKINKEFQTFFELMFGGGSAALSVVSAPVRRRVSDLDLSLSGEDEEAEPEEDVEEGIDVRVSLPRKKIRGLDMLSGGERALTSIALLFAMSQVNPPPFLILDETDAALDEANSKRYGDMIENLSKHSQLILITHNRETMKRAGVLYGVTMGRDGVSKLLSVQFEEAVAVAK